MSTNSEEKRKEKRDKILQEAITLFSRNGYSQTTISDVAKASDVSFGSVFTYFSSKENLFRAAVSEPLEKWGPLFFDVAEKDGTPLEKIQQMVREQVKVFLREGPYLRLIQYVLGQPDRFEEEVKNLDHFLDQFQVTLRPIIEQGQECGELERIDPNLVTLSYLSFINGIRLTLTDYFDYENWELYVDQALRLFGPIPKERR
ncbi:MAG TPA: TetR/AcrR family transcriptional regulator [Bacillales bacterium]|nr:TetR/AcrR family transcriptional regulator [Bacillales bacterium]